MPTGRSDTSREHERAQSLLESVQAVIGGSEDDVLKPRLDSVSAAVAGLGTSDAVDVQVIHGDLHVGQMLRSAGDDIVVTDFDGDPVTDSGPGDGLRTPMVDLASLVQSVDHVGRIVARRQPDLGPGVDELVGEATAAVIASYEELATVDETTLWSLRIAQELHELVYAAKHLPHWRYVPEGALAARLPW